MAVSPQNISRELPLDLAPNIACRLSQKALLWIAVGVNAIMNATATRRWFLTDSEEWIRRTEIPGAEPTRFDTKTFDLIVGLWGILRPIHKRERNQRTYRLWLNVVEVEICIFAVRLAGKISPDNSIDRKPTTRSTQPRCCVTSKTSGNDVNERWFLSLVQ
jgi:hypothetical protein